MKKLLTITAASLGLVTISGIVITQTPNWKHSEIRQQWKECKTKVDNLQSAGRVADSVDLLVQCIANYERSMAEAFGTTKASEAPTPIW